MRHAPAVHIPVGPSLFGVGLLALLALWSLAVLLAWVWSSPPDIVRPACVAVVLVLSVAIAWRSLRRVQPGVLHGDGQAWTWRTGEAESAVRVGVALDLQRLMLVWVAPADGARRFWLWIHPCAQEGQGLALRRALYAQDLMAQPPLARVPSDTAGFRAHS